MIYIVKHDDKCKKLKPDSDYSLYVNETLKADFKHIREPEDLAKILRDAADQVDLDNGITPPHLEKAPVKKKKLSMMERLNGIQHHLETTA